MQSARSRAESTALYWFYHRPTTTYTHGLPSLASMPITWAMALSLEDNRDNLHLQRSDLLAQQAASPDD